MANEKEKKSYMDKMKKWAKVGMVAGMATMAGMSQSDASNNQPFMENGTQTHMEEAKQTDTKQELQQLCAKYILLQQRAVQVSRQMRVQPGVAQAEMMKIKQELGTLTNKIVVMQSLNPEIQIPGLTIFKDVEQKVHVRVQGSVRGNQVILGQSSPNQNMTRNQMQTRIDGQER